MLAAPAATILATILIRHPYFGLFDDADLLRQSGSIWTRTLRFMHHDVGVWGMVRPFYAVLAEPYYSIGNHSPIGLYVANWLTVVAVFALLGFAFARALDVPVSRRPLYFAGFASACFAYPWTMFLFSYASLQEKWILLVGALMLLWVGVDRTDLARLRWAAVTCVLITLGFLVKDQFAVFVPIVLLVIAGRQVDRRFRLLVALGVSSVAVVTLGFVARRGSYTAGKWNLANVEPQLRSHVGLLFVALLFLFIALAYIFGRSATLEERLRLLIPAAGLASFLVVFLPWPQGLKVISGLDRCFSFGAAGGIIAARLGVRTAWTAVTIAAFIAVAWSGYRGLDLFGRLASVGALAKHAPVDRLAEHRNPIYLSCPEGGLSLAYYIARERSLTVRIEGPSGAANAPEAAIPSGATAVIQGRDCPAVLDGGWRTVWTSGEKNGLTLFERR